MLVIRDLAGGPKRTTELLMSLHPISSRTLLGRLRDMEADEFIERRDYGGNPPRVEYELTKRGQLLIPFLTELKKLGEQLGCGECEERKQNIGTYCEACPNRFPFEPVTHHSPQRHEIDDSVFLL
jgi:DNA-binding HxlR family transcriptional regulator